MTSLLQKINTLDTKVDGLDSSNLQTQIDTNTNDISTLQTSKQNTIIAGDNITIMGDTISSTGGGTTIDSSTDLSCNTLDTVGDVNIGGNLTTPNRISFYAATDKTLFVVNQGVVAPFERIVQNIGNAYDNTTYQFTAPVAGTYYFGFSFYSDRNIGFVTEIQVNGNTIARGQRNPGYTSSYTKYQISATAFCSVGDVVRAISGANTIVIQELNHTHFFGFFIG
jgi:hypothetical protein